MTRTSAHRFLQPALVSAIFCADRWTKVWAEGSLAPVRSIRVLPFFHLTYVQNTGAAWGMMQGRNAFLIGFSVLLLAALLFLKRRWPKTNFWSHYGLVLVAGGALGNLYDRIVFGYVIDFLDFLVWPVFNVADSCITVGACCLAWGLHRAEKEEARLEG